LFNPGGDLFYWNFDGSALEYWINGVIEYGIRKGHRMTNMKKEIKSPAQVNGIEIAFETFGDRANPPLLLINGLGGQMINWHEDFCAQFTNRGFWVIRFDNRDVGLSSMFDRAGIPDINEITRAQQQGKTIETPYSLWDMASDAIGLLDFLGISSAHVLGSSMGGRIAQITALLQPERVKTLTSIMATMGEPGFPPPNPETLTILSKPAPPNREGNIDHALLIARLFSGPEYPVDENLVRERAAVSFDRSFNPGGVTRQMAALMTTGSCKEKLRLLDVPTLVIHGSADPLIPVECARDIADTIPGAKLMLLSGMGHSLTDIPLVWPLIVDALADHALT